jgi:hypothetical protein
VHDRIPDGLFSSAECIVRDWQRRADRVGLRQRLGARQRPPLGQLLLPNGDRAYQQHHLYRCTYWERSLRGQQRCLPCGLIKSAMIVVGSTHCRPREEQVCKMIVEYNEMRSNAIGKLSCCDGLTAAEPEALAYRRHLVCLQLRFLSRLIDNPLQPLTYLWGLCGRNWTPAGCGANHMRRVRSRALNSTLKGRKRRYTPNRITSHRIA